MRILITGGGCEEPIDNVRSICNFSTGRTAKAMADFIHKEVPSTFVTSIMSNRSEKPTDCRVLTYKSFSDLYSLVKTECSTGNYDIVIHAAAVSDYSPESILIDGKEYKIGEISKINSNNSFEIKMKKNPKIIEFIKEWFEKKVFLVGFKLTSNATKEEQEFAVNTLFKIKNPPDIVVANDLSLITEKTHLCSIYDRNGLSAETKNINELMEKIMEAFYDYDN